MIEFASLFLFLVVGTQDVRVLVAGDVARVALVLDGTTAAEMTSAPWMAPLDFGDDLRPHELEAVAYDREGRQVGRASQRINRARPPADVKAVVERAGPAWRARLEWSSLTSESPRSFSVRLDGLPVRASNPHSIELPSLDANRRHLLTAELTFEGGLHAETYVAFGGGPTDEASSRLTPIPIVLSEGSRPPATETMQQWFTAAERPLRVAAVEEGRADVVIVAASGARERLDAMGRARVLPGAGAVLGRTRHVAPLPKDQVVTVVWPVPTRRVCQSEVAYELFPRSGERTARDGGLLWILNHLHGPSTESSTERVADGVALAGMAAAANDRRRAVVLLPGADISEDASEFTSEAVRAYLRRLNVPLFVWCLDGTRAGAWGACTNVSSTRSFEDAAHAVASAVSRQRIVWVEGSHAMRDIALTSHASGVTLAE
jgi:hypothetical protein